MAYPSKFERLEQRHGKPIAEILVERLNDLGSVERVAVDIGISYRHVVNKVNELGLIKDVTWRLPEPTHG
jgi:molybdenum-dependent DNA-binding transcriptional regulator ModE